MVERDFDGAKGPESVGPSGGDARLVVEALDGAAGQRLSFAKTPSGGQGD
jgi:hypothetical protein